MQESALPHAKSALTVFSARPRYSGSWQLYISAAKPEESSPAAPTPTVPLAESQNRSAPERSAILQHPAHLQDRVVRAQHMLQGFQAHDDIERLVGEGQRLTGRIH